MVQQNTPLDFEGLHHSEHVLLLFPVKKLSYKLDVYPLGNC